jgi:exonuclease SbcC
MELRELRVTRLPGIDQPFTVAAGPGLNLVLGPNGSGKSSLSRAALGLLWPDARQDGHLVTAAWEIDGRTWLAERAGGPAVSWQHDGEPAPAPRLPSSRHAGIYRLGVLDLLKATADATDAELAAEIRRQLAGGVDVAALRKRFEHTGHEGRTEAQRLQETRNRVRERRERLQDLADDEAQLADLEAQHHAARAARERLQALLAGRDLAAAMAALQRISEDLTVFPAVMDRLRGDEDERLAQLLDDRSRAAADLDEARLARAAADEDLADAGLEDGGPDDAALAVLRDEVARARDLATELRAAEDDAAAADAALDEARTQLGALEPPSEDEPVSMDAARAAVTRLRDRDRDRATRDGLDRLLARDDLGRAGTAAGDPAALATARGALGDWLAAAAPPMRWPRRIIPWLAMAGLLALGLVLRPWQGSWWPGWAAVGTAVLLAILHGVLDRRAGSDRRRRRQAARTLLASTDVAEPDAWTRDEVSRQLRGLVAEEAAAVQARLRDQLRQALHSERDLVATRLDDDDPDAELDQALVLQRVAAWHAARQARAAAARRRDDLAARLADQVDRIRNQLAPWWTGDAADPASLGHAVADLERRRDRHRHAEARRVTSARLQTGARARHDAAQEQLDALLTRLDLGEDDAAPQIADLLGRRAAYLKAREAMDRATVERERCRRACDELPPAVREVAREALAWTEADRDEAIADTTLRADRADELLREITTIRTRLDQARGDRQLAAARTAEESLVRQLEQIRDTVRGQALATLLLDGVVARHELATEPPLLQRTQELFARFTDGRYGLTVVDADQDAGFRAQDTASGRGLALTELSDGTRAQLLLAARLAAIPEQERGLRPPLFLDESLTASDAVRFRAVGKAVLDLIEQEGRQVFYLTCDPADVDAWQSLLAERQAAAAPVTDLATVRGLAAAAAPERLRPAVTAAIPEPTGSAAAFGAAVGVSPLDVTANLGAVHLFHLLRDDLPLLAALLRRRVERVGQLRALADDLRADGTIDEKAWSELEARGVAMTAFLDAVAVGRGRPIPAGAILQRSGIETSKLSEIEDLARRLDGDPDRLVSALEAGEVKRLQQAKKDELTDWLTAQGYLDRRSVLARDEVRHRTIRAARANLAGGALDWETLDQLIDAWWVATVGAGDDNRKPAAD